MSPGTCPICDAPDPVELEPPSRVPTLMNLMYPTSAAARDARRGTLAMAGCRRCGMVWNRAFTAEAIDYDAKYENDQSNSGVFAAHVEARARDVVAAVPAGPIDFLEIGCGQGGFIAEMARVAGKRLRWAEGFDPAWRGAADAPGMHIHKAYFSATTARELRRQPNVVASRHTINQVPDPVGFLAAIRRSLAPDSVVPVFVETPCVAWILRHEALQDFSYEYCSLFTAGSLAYALGRAGFSHPTATHVFGGQYLWVRADAGGPPAPPPIPEPVDFASLAGTRTRFTERWRAAVLTARARGTVAIWGAGAKGVSFALMTDPEGSAIDHVIDINPAKHGLFLAGTGLPVLSPEQSAARRPMTVFVMNPNYVGEIGASLKERGLATALVPIN